MSPGLRGLLLDCKFFLDLRDCMSITEKFDLDQAMILFSRTCSSKSPEQPAKQEETAGPQKNKVVTGAMKNSNVGRNLEQIQIPGGIICL